MDANRIPRGPLMWAICGLLGWMAQPAHAQTSSAQLTITMTVQSSISLVFQNSSSVGAKGFCPLKNPGTNSVGLDLGTASFSTGNDSLSCVAYARLGSATYQVSSSFDIVVSKANTGSPNYQLAAEISTAPPPNVLWLINNGSGTFVPLSTAFTQLDSSDSYGAAVTKTLQVQVKNSVPAQVLSETITFLATAN